MMKNPPLHTANSTEKPLGLTAFDFLRAEDEPWLLQVFESPPEFDLLVGNRSAIIFGDSGSGKTAVYKAVEKSSLTPNKPLRLLVPWHPMPPMAGDTTDLGRKQLNQVLDACAMSILTYLVQYPSTFDGAREWAKDYLTWFIRQYLEGFELRVGSLVDEIDEFNQLPLADMADPSTREAFPANAPPQIIIKELVKALETVKLEGVWVLVDGLEAWAAIEPDLLAIGLKSFLSALNIFEQKNFAYKIFLPSTLKRSLSSAGGIIRRRLDMHHLDWPISKLIALVEKRLVLASGGKVDCLAKLCEDEGLSVWLERCGANSPRGWLEAVRPLIAAYLERADMGQFDPITEEEWREIRRRHPPPLSLDEPNQQVIVGSRVVKDIPKEPYKMLQYLYKNSNQVCTRANLYYTIWCGLDEDKMPSSPSDTAWDPPTTYNGIIDTAIWRLRQVIEPDPNDPLFIITVKRQGIRLENAW